MKKLFVTLFALAMLLPARAQMTPEAVMAMTPDLPSSAQLLRHWNEHNDPNRKEAPDSDILNEFMEAWRDAQQQINDMQAKSLAPGVRHDVMAGKVGGTKKTASQVSQMSESEAKALAMSTMKGRLSSMGLSQADVAKMQSGNLSEAEQKALADKMMAAQTGGLTTKDVEAMENMSDEQRKEFMEQSGLGASVSKKMNADKGKRASSQKQYQLVTKMTGLAQDEYSLQQKAYGMIETARKEGMDLFNRKYGKADASYRAEMQALAGPAEEDDAAAARLRATWTAWFKNRSNFYAEFIPMYRDAVVGAMDCSRAQILPLKRQRKEVMEQLYALTGSAEYALSETVPFEASSMYFELSEKIVDFELELPY